MKLTFEQAIVSPMPEGTTTIIIITFEEVTNDELARLPSHLLEQMGEALGYPGEVQCLIKDIAACAGISVRTLLGDKDFEILFPWGEDHIPPST